MDRIRNLSKTQILVILGALSIISLIILPWWVVGSDGQSGWGLMGEGLGLGSLSILLIPLAAIVIAGLIYFYKTTEEKQWLYCLIASAVTLIPVLWFFFLKQRGLYKYLTYGFGYWVNLLIAFGMVGICAYTVYQQRQAK
jgi:small-conductance mechanosensitive channel